MNGYEVVTMCGRYTAKMLPSDIHGELGVEEVPADLRPRWNIAPTQEVPVVVLEGARKLRLFRWGLIPHWAEEASIGSKHINARAETLEEKPSFRESFRSRRCLVVADGFYEWKRNGASKMPMYISRGSRGLLAFAGLWSEWTAPTGIRVRSFSIVTTAPNRLIAHIHDRMPAILQADAYETWLSPDAEASGLRALLRPYPGEDLEAFPVSPKVNSVAIDGPELINRVQVPQQQTLF